MVATRLSFALAVTSWGLGCGAAPPESTVPDQDVTGESEVVVESGTLMLVDGSEMVPISIRFGVDSAELDERDKRVLALLGEFLRANDHLTRIEVQGHSDERGSEDYNMRLSRRRARLVAKQLTAEGVEGSRLRVEWFGDKRPAVRGKGESVWSQNRRVQFVILDQEPP